MSRVTGILDRILAVYGLVRQDREGTFQIDPQDVEMEFGFSQADVDRYRSMLTEAERSSSPSEEL